MKLVRLFVTLLAALAMVACGEKEPVVNPDNQGGAPDGALVPPSGVAIVEGTLSTTSVTIKWEAVQGAVGYKYVLQVEDIPESVYHIPSTALMIPSSVIPTLPRIRLP